MAEKTDLLQSFTGISTQSVLSWLHLLQNQRDELEARLLHLLTDRPLQSNIGFILSCSSAFYLAEHKLNPQINTFVDAMYYISTCLTVGYADLFPVTQSGRAIATLAMTVGPALTAELLEPPHRAAAASESGQEQLIVLLEAILEELRKEN